MPLAAAVAPVAVQLAISAQERAAVYQRLCYAARLATHRGAAAHEARRCALAAQRHAREVWLAGAGLFELRCIRGVLRAPG